MSDPAKPSKPEPRRPARAQRPDRPAPRAVALGQSATPVSTTSSAKSPRAADALSELAAIAGSGVAPSAYVPSPTLDFVLKRDRRDKPAESWRELALPSLVVLGVSLPMLGVAWFLLDPLRVIRTTPLGVGVPILLFVAGAACLGATAALLVRGGPIARK